jgi:hypothetical protein
MIVDLLTNKNSKEKSLVKAQEISKLNHSGLFNVSEYGVRIEIIGDVIPIKVNELNGIEIFARAWKNGKQLGFGKDGSVEIERFRIFNPPILVSDPNGLIIREGTDDTTLIPQQKHFREDPLEAIRQSIAHTVKLVGKENANIIIGKVGNTTSTFYPDANAESTSVDGNVQRAGVQEAFATIVAGAGTTVQDADPVDGTTNLLEGVRARFGAADPNFSRVGRDIFLFDTSAIPDTDTISSATFSMYGAGSLEQTAINATDRVMHIVATTPASNTALAAADYGQFGTTSFGSFDPGASFASWATAYNDFTVNATGLANISKTGITKFGVRLYADMVGSWTSGWGGLGATSDSRLYCQYADTAGTANDPKLVVVHSGAAVTAYPGGSFLLMGVGM